MKRVIIVHGWGGSPHEEWMPWLASELRDTGCNVVVPEMPDTDTPVIESWVEKLREVVGIPDSETYFVGHSIGCQTIMRYLENLTGPVGGAVFVAGWFNLENLEDEDSESIARPWIGTPIDIARVKKVLLRSVLIISDNDPYGALEENKEKFNMLVTKTVILPGAAHITDERVPLILNETVEILAR